MFDLLTLLVDNYMWSENESQPVLQQTFHSLGVLTLTITNPIWVTKTRLVLQYGADPTHKQYKGMMDALVKIYRYEGVAGLYKVCVCVFLLMVMIY